MDLFPIHIKICQRVPYGSFPGVKWPGYEVNHSPPSPAAYTRLLSFTRKHSRVVTGFTGHNTPRRRLHLIWLTNSPLHRRCGAKDETLGPILCECESLALLRHVHLGPFFLDPKGIKSLSLRDIWNFSKGTGLPWSGIRLWSKNGLFLRPRYIGTIGAWTQLLINQSLPSCAKDENEWSYTSAQPIHLHGVDRENFTFYKNMQLATFWYLLPFMSLQVNLITFKKYLQLLSR